ncbi:hypothetical protein [Priestia megaterium]|uniref:hypothetical protein n=1 Tax=Priestia megaterium TaxID=1404 RepID=UPI0032425773
MINAGFTKNIQSFLISHQIDLFREYSKYIESSFQKELTFYEDGAKKVQEEEEEDYWDFYLDDVIQYSKDFPRIMRNSLFVSIYTFLEDKIVELCVPNESTLLKLSDIKGQGIEQASLYLKKVLLLDFPDNSKEWHYIRKANLIRNCIVHSNGVISKSRSKDKLVKAIDEMSFVTKDHNGHINLESQFCLEFLENVHSFLRQLYKIDN